MQELMEFNFELWHILGKRHVPADFLSWPLGVDQEKDDNKEMVLLSQLQGTVAQSEQSIGFSSASLTPELTKLNKSHDHGIWIYHVTKVSEYIMWP